MTFTSYLSPSRASLVTFPKHLKWTWLCFDCTRASFVTTKTLPSNQHPPSRDLVFWFGFTGHWKSPQFLLVSVASSFQHLSVLCNLRSMFCDSVTATIAAAHLLKRHRSQMQLGSVTTPRRGNGTTEVSGSFSGAFRVLFGSQSDLKGAQTMKCKLWTETLEFSRLKVPVNLFLTNLVRISFFSWFSQRSQHFFSNLVRGHKNTAIAGRREENPEILTKLVRRRLARKVPNSRSALHGKRPSLIHGLCAFFASNSRLMPF